MVGENISEYHILSKNPGTVYSTTFVGTDNYVIYVPKGCRRLVRLRRHNPGGAIVFLQEHARAGRSESIAAVCALFVLTYRAKSESDFPESRVSSGTSTVPLSDPQMEGKGKKCEKHPNL